jgi:hypothetical protein
MANCECWYNPETGYVEACCPEHKQAIQEEIAMSKEVELPPIVFQAATEDLWESHTRCVEELKQAHAQIAALTAVNNGLSERITLLADRLEDARKVAEKAEAELAERTIQWNGALNGEQQNFKEIVRLRAELVALREGATVYYRVDWKEKSEAMYHRDHDQHQTIRTAQYMKESQEDSGYDAVIVEVITRERILDTAEPKERSSE